MLDLIQIPPIVAQPVSRVRYLWEAEEFKRMRFNLFWEGQSRASKILLIVVDAFVTAMLGRAYGFGAALAFNIAWSVPLTIFYEKKRGNGDDDVFVTPKVKSKWSPFSWILYLVKVVAFAGFKDVIIAKIISFLRWWSRKLPQPALQAEKLIMVVGVTLLGIRGSHQILKEAGMAHTAIISWNTWGRFLNASFQVLDAAYQRWFWTTTWIWGTAILSTVWVF